MSLKPKDPLLATARIVLAFAMGAFGLAFAVCLIAVPAIAIMRDEVVGELARSGAMPSAVWAICGFVALIAVVCALGLLFLRNLYRIVGTVGEGDPFIPVNADRLSGMAWIVVGVHVLAIPIAVLATQIDRLTEGHDGQIKLSFGGLLLALVLFILARVFREGTRLRDELEGTV